LLFGQSDLEFYIVDLFWLFPRSADTHT
jgi:hypothetical protein